MIISSEYLALRSGKNFKQSERKWIGTRLYNRINTRFVLCLEWFFWDYQRFQRIHSNYASIFSNIISDFAAQSSKFLLCCFQMLRGVECWTFSSNWIVASHFGELDLSIYYLHAYIPYLRTVMSKYTSPPSSPPFLWWSRTRWCSSPTTNNMFWTANGVRSVRPWIYHLIEIK